MNTAVISAAKIDMLLSNSSVIQDTFRIISLSSFESALPFSHVHFKEYFLHFL